MDYNYLRENTSFFEWHKYFPLDVQYIKYADSNPSVIAVGHKIDDVFQAYANARASFMFANSENFGDLSGPNDMMLGSKGRSDKIRVIIRNILKENIRDMA